MITRTSRGLAVVAWGLLVPGLGQRRQLGIAQGRVAGAGCPCSDGTRISVMDIVKLERMGLPPA
jgi:hypothetical protein